MTHTDSQFECHIDIQEASQKAVSVLAQATGFSRKKIKLIMGQGAVWFTHNGSTQRLRRASRELNPGDIVHLYYDEKVLEQSVPAATLIADEGDFSVWYKPCGMLSQGSKWGDHTTIYRYAEQHLTPQRPAFIVHRLDRAATGLILIAHKKKVAAALSELFKQKQVEKYYYAIVHGKFAEGTTTLTSEVDDKPATSHVRLFEYNASTDQSLVEVKIETGRKHQVRKHLSSQDFPIVGDRLYGQQGDKENLQLAAIKLRFYSPLDNKLKEYQLATELLPVLGKQ